MTGILQRAHLRGRPPPRGARSRPDIETWAARAILDCVEANEDAAGLGRCEGCEKVMPAAELSAPDDDGVRVCPACNVPDQGDDDA
jgi:hypothetical protein